jgi:hypothetical protein
MGVPLRRHQTLREIYEAAYGRAVDDRTWRRIKSPQRLCFNDEDMHLTEVVKMAAKLQSQSPCKRVTQLMARKALRIQKDFPTEIVCTGEQLYESICRVVGYQVPRQTVYRWGKEIGCRFRLRDRNSHDGKKWYSSEQLKKWAQKVIPNSEVI